ncbi:MAG: helix-turn-helix transcriptional regulator [Elusimicrobia bacterium]|nr:helix-turn-helix transcriptional regulator [Elusimicrobiota bacterium]
MDAIYREVGERIRAKRLRLGLTLEELAELSGLHASYIGQIERNGKKASLQTIAAVAKALGVPAGRLFASGPLKRAGSLSEQMELLLRSNSPKKRAVMLGVLLSLSKELRKI